MRRTQYFIRNKFKVKLQTWFSYGRAMMMLSCCWCWCCCCKYNYLLVAYELPGKMPKLRKSPLEIGHSFYLLQRANNIQTPNTLPTNQRQGEQRTIKIRREKSNYLESFRFHHQLFLLTPPTIPAAAAAAGWQYCFAVGTKVPLLLALISLWHHIFVIHLIQIL